MITRRMAAALVAGSLAVGLAAGTAGTIIANDVTPSPTTAASCLEYMDDVDSMMAGQNGMMSGTGGMMGGPDMMGGAGSSFGPGMMGGAGSSFGPGVMGGAGMMGGAGSSFGPGMMGGQSGSGAMPDWMQQHHAATTPVPVQ